MPLVDDAPHIREANAGAFELVGAVQALKHPEQFAGVLHVEADAVVAHEDDRFAFVARRVAVDANLDGAHSAGRACI